MPATCAGIKASCLNAAVRASRAQCNIPDILDRLRMRLHCQHAFDTGDAVWCPPPLPPRWAFDGISAASTQFSSAHWPPRPPSFHIRPAISSHLWVALHLLLAYRSISGRSDTGVKNLLEGMSGEGTSGALFPHAFRLLVLVMKVTFRCSLIGHHQQLSNHAKSSQHAAASISVA